MRPNIPVFRRRLGNTWPESGRASSELKAAIKMVSGEIAIKEITVPFRIRAGDD